MRFPVILPNSDITILTSKPRHILDESQESCIVELLSKFHQSIDCWSINCSKWGFRDGKWNKDHGCPPFVHRLKRKLILRRRGRTPRPYYKEDLLDLVVRNKNTLLSDGVPNPKSLSGVSELQLLLEDLTSTVHSDTLSLSYDTVLEKFTRKSSTRVNRNFLTFREALGLTENSYLCYLSPYTGKLLKPFIWRKKNCSSVRINLHNELLAHPKYFRRDYWHIDDLHPQIAPIAAIRSVSTTLDFCYVRPEHIDQLNQMASTYFWPGIELVDCLNYPDYTCVCLYRKLVIGFGTTIPNFSPTEMYISFLVVRPQWRQLGVATFILYHLLQMAHGKDVRLHVSPSNPAMLLYQKFGFSVEAMVLNFYDKYLLPQDDLCRHAYLMTLMRS